MRERSQGKDLGRVFTSSKVKICAVRESCVFEPNDVPKAKAKELFPRGFVEIRPWFRLAPPPEAGS